MSYYNAPKHLQPTGNTLNCLRLPIIVCQHQNLYSLSNFFICLKKTQRTDQDMYFTPYILTMLFLVPQLIPATTLPSCVWKNCTNTSLHCAKAIKKRYSLFHLILLNQRNSLTKCFQERHLFKCSNKSRVN